MMNEYVVRRWEEEGVIEYEHCKVCIQGTIQRIRFNGVTVWCAEFNSRA
jgi:hypothetical protein